MSAVLLVVIAACSGPSEDAAEAEDDPRAALRQAIATLGDYDGMATTVSVDLDDTAQAELATRGELSEQDAELLSTTRLRIVSGPMSGGVADVAASVGIDGADVLEFRNVDGGRIFVRLDLSVIQGLDTGADMADESLDGLVEMGGMLGVADAAAALTEGRWIEVTGLEEAMEAADVGSSDASRDDDDAGDPADDRAISEAIVAILEDFVDGDVEVTHVGEEGGADRVQVTTDGAAVKQLLSELTAVVEDQELVADASDGLPTEIDLDDDAEVIVDAWIEDGALSRVALDLALAGDLEVTGAALLVLEFDEAADRIEVPADAEVVDLEQLVTGFFGTMFGGLGGEAGFGDGGFDVGDPGEGDPGDLPTDGDGSTDGGDTDGDAADGDGTVGDGTDGDVGDPAPPEGGLQGTPVPDCVSAEELEALAEFAGPEAVEPLQDLIDQGLLPLC